MLRELVDCPRSGDESHRRELVDCPRRWRLNPTNGGVGGYFGELVDCPRSGGDLNPHQLGLDTSGRLVDCPRRLAIESHQRELVDASDPF